MSERLTRRAVLKRGGAVGSAAALASTAGCTGAITGGGGGTTVKVGSKRFTEQELLGYMSLEALRANSDVTVKNEVGLGGTTTNFKALQNGDIDLYWEYTGTAWATLPPKHDKVITDPEKIYQKVEEEFESEHGITLLERAPFNNTYVLCANPKWSEKTGVKTISGFADYVTSGNTDFTIALDAEFQERSDGWPGLAKHYGFDGVTGKLDVKNVSPGLVYQIMGSGEAKVGMGFNTNPKILKYDLVVLEDDEKFFPVYNPAPMVKQKTLDNAPSVQDPLNKVASALDTDTIRNLNKKVSIDGKGAQEVAKNFLSSEGII
jgi:osmoprotectant transport system substrate-binding protein